MSRETKKIPTKSGLLLSGEVREFEGLNNIDDPSTLTLADLVVLRNTDVDDRKRLRRRRGRASLVSGNFHSLWSDGIDCLVVKDTSLYSVDQLWNLTLLRESVGQARMSYVKVNGTIFYSNGLVIGAVKNRADLSIPPLSGSAPSYKAALFPARLLEHLGARLYLANGNVVWYTDALDYYKMGTGLYVSDSENVWWIEGLSPKKSQIKKVGDSPAVMYSDTSIDASLIKAEMQGHAAVWTGDGIHIGLPDGSVVNVVQGRYEVPGAVYGSPLVRTDGNRTLYTCSLSMS
jgi:hypothetical protein